MCLDVINNETPPESGYSAVDGHFDVVGDIPAGILHAVQIIASPFMAVDALLQDFDISTHCVGYTPNGKRHEIPQTTSLLIPPKVVNSNIPDLTLSRYRRIVQRYGLTPDPDELVRLCLMPDKSESKTPKVRSISQVPQMMDGTADLDF